MCANFRFPLFYISENCLKISIHTDIYCLKAINSTCYKYLDNSTFAFQKLSKNVKY